MTSAAHFASRLFNTPALMLPGASPLAMDLLTRTAGGVQASSFGIAADEEAEADDRYRPYEIVAGIAIVPIKGVLLQRLPMWLWYYGDLLGIAGYDRIRLQFMSALADPKVDAIVLDIDSPGGDVAGCFDLVDTIYAARGDKPIWAILGENAYSAAYALASAADHITVPRTGGTGSIGVIYMHLSIADWLAKTGVKPTLVTKGDLKGEGSEFFDLSEDAFDRLKADVVAVGDIFDATVARNRGLQKKVVTATQAGTFLGAKGVDIGLADAVMAPDAAFRALLKQLD